MANLFNMFTLSLALVACGGKAADKATTAPKAEGTLFELGELTIFEGKDAMVKIHADGNSELGGHSSASQEVVWKAGPTFKTDGSVEWKGKAVARVNADGTVQDLEHGKPVPVTITADKVTFDKGSISLAADGTMTLETPNPAKPEASPHVVGADTPGKRRLVLTLVALMLTGDEQGESHVEGSPPTTVPVQPIKP